MRFSLFIVALAAGVATPVWSQDVPVEAPPPPETAPDSATEAVIDTAGIELPELIGGLGAITSSLEYPVSAQAAGAEGRVVVTFVVSETGNVEDAEVTATVHPALDREALVAVRRARFVPAHRDGRPLRVRMALPVTFELPSRRGV